MKIEKIPFLGILIPAVIVGLILGFALNPSSKKKEKSAVRLTEVGKKEKSAEWLTEVEKKELVAEGLQQKVSKPEVSEQLKREIKDIHKDINTLMEYKKVYEDIIEELYVALRNQGFSHEEAIKKIKAIQ